MGIPVYAGAFIDRPSKGGDKDEAEMQGISDIAKNTPIKAAIIGNEYYLRHKDEPGALDYLISRIQEFKNAYPNIPVATADVDSIVFNWSGDNVPTINPVYKPVLDQVDVLFVHIYPFWSNLPVNGAAEYTIDRYLAIKSLIDTTYGGKKQVIIGEAGWPSQGETGDNANEQVGASSQASSASQPVFHAEDQRQYMIELLALAQQKHVDLFYFDAFDELWKTEGVDGVGRNWGYNYSDRTVKYNFSGLLIPPEDLPSSTQGDIYNPFPASDFNWGKGSYPVYTEWPQEPKASPNALTQGAQFSIAYMGDYKNISMFQCDRNSHSGETAIKINVIPGGLQKWSGAYWLYPKDNWGKTQQGIDLSASKKLTFWARGETGNEVVEFVTGGICGNYDGKTPPLCSGFCSTKNIHRTNPANEYLDKIFAGFEREESSQCNWSVWILRQSNLQSFRSYFLS